MSRRTRSRPAGSATRRPRRSWRRRSAGVIVASTPPAATRRRARSSESTRALSSTGLIMAHRSIVRFRTMAWPSMDGRPVQVTASHGVVEVEVDLKSTERTRRYSSHGDGTDAEDRGREPADGRCRLGAALLRGQRADPRRTLDRRPAPLPARRDPAGVVHQRAPSRSVSVSARSVTYMSSLPDGRTPDRADWERVGGVVATPARRADRPPRAAEVTGWPGASGAAASRSTSARSPTRRIASPPKGPARASWCTTDRRIEWTTADHGRSCTPGDVRLREAASPRGMRSARGGGGTCGGGGANRSRGGVGGNVTWLHSRRWHRRRITPPTESDRPKGGSRRRTSG